MIESKHDPYVQVLDHPLATTLLTRMRMKDSPIHDFREALRQITFILIIEATKRLPLELTTIQTPLEQTVGYRFLGGPPVFCAILRAGLPMTEVALRLFPEAPIGLVGLFRDPVTKKPVDYYTQLPPLKDKIVFLLDPMLATGGSAVRALEMIHEQQPRELMLVSILAAPQGIQKVREAYNQVPVLVGAIDRELNDHAYILPGLGDAGDRLFGTGA